MRYSATHKQETRQRIIRAAARHFRGRGSEGAAIGDLMRDLHMTHGGFYRHFASKEDLLVAAFGEDANGLSGKMLSVVERAPRGGQLKALIDAYLDIEHCENAADGCPVAALATELARRPPSSKARLAFEKILKERTARMAKYMPGVTQKEQEAKARMLLSAMAGTLTIARVLTDEAAMRRFLDDAKKFYLQAVSQ